MSESRDESGISDEAREIFSWFMYVVICQLINIFGIVTNIINIICFKKQGFHDSVNISLVGLALSDIGSLATLIWTCISVTPTFMAAKLSFELLDITYLASAIPHMAFTRVSACLTAMITLERCLCITAPLQIKNLITPNRATLITVTLFVVFFFSGCPVYVVNRLGMTFSPLRNRTLIALIAMEGQTQVDMISFAINNFSIPFGAFVIIVVCTTIISVKLKMHSKWRKKTIANASDDRISGRNQKAAKMVVMISILFIVCFVPLNVMMVTAGLIPEMLVNGKYMNISAIIGGFSFVMEGINSSMNIFIYYHMSTVYRETFQKTFICQKWIRFPQKK